jgi:tetratricopeptide (TPR) repeat protein
MARLNQSARALLLTLPFACAHVPRGEPAPGWSAYLRGDAAGAAAGLAASPDLLSRLGRANLVHDAAHYAEARPLWMDLLHQAARERQSPWSRAVAAFAAHRIGVIAGEVDRPSAAWAGALEEAAALDVGPEARVILAEGAAQEWMRLGDAGRVARLDQARGCPDRVRVAGPEPGPVRSRLAAPWGAPAVGEAAAVRSCLVPLRGRDGRGGVYTVTLGLVSPDAREALLWVDSGAPFALDGYLYESPDRFLARRVWLRLRVPAGRSRIDVRVVGGARDSVSLGLLSPDGAPGVVRFDGDGAAPPVRAAALGPVLPSASPPASGDAAAIAELLSAHERYRQGDADGAREHLARLLSMAPRFAPLWALVAAVDLIDPALTPPVARDHARAALSRAWTLDPGMGRAAHNLALIEREDERLDEAAHWVAEGRGVAPNTFRFDLLAAEIFLERGWDREAADALRRALGQRSGSCDVLRAAFSFAQHQDDAAAEEARAGDLRRCDATSDSWADLLRRRGRLTQAREEYHRLLALRPEAGGWRQALADVLVAQGDREMARRELLGLVAEDPRAAEPRRRLADLALGDGDTQGAQRVLAEGLAADPGSRVLEHALRAIGGHDPMDDFRIDGREVVRTFEADPWRPGRDAPAVIVLDRTVLLVQADGSTRSLTHNIMRVLTKDGIERFGEVEIPGDADVLTVRTLKADGRVREAQDIPGKEALSAPDLQVGDYVELEWIDRDPPSARYPGGFVADRFYFRSYDAPLYRTEYVVVLPAGLAPLVDRRADAPVPREEVRDGRRVLNFAMGHMDQLVPEPGAGPFLDDVPSVRVASGVSWRAWRDDLGETVRKNGRIGLEAVTLAHRLCPGTPEAACVAALGRFVAEVDTAGSALGSAAVTFAERSGSRVMLLRALLRAVGLRPEVWMARPRPADVADGTIAETEGFGVPLLRLPLSGRTLWLDPRPRRAIPGYVAPALRGARAIAVEGGGEPRWNRVGDGEGRDRRGLSLEVGLRADGSAKVSGTEELEGWPAVGWREALGDIARDRWQEEFEQRWLGFYFPGSALSRLDVGALPDIDRPLRLAWELAAPRVGRAQDGELRVPLGFFPALVGRAYVGVSARRSALQVDEQVETLLRVRVTVPAGLRVLALPDDANLETSFGRYRRRVRTEGAAIVVEREFRMPEQRVAPADYPAFVRFASAVDAYDAEEAVLRR